MKILVLLIAYFFSLGFALNETVRSEKANANAEEATRSAADMEVPVMHVLLDTVEITPIAPDALAGNL